jgi:hypothetical protein
LRACTNNRERRGEKQERRREERERGKRGGKKERAWGIFFYILDDASF